MNITTNFTQTEFLPAKVGKWNSLPEKSKYMAAVLAATLETIRKEVRCKFPEAVIVLNSGIRTPDYNAKIGGSKTSDHLFGISGLSVGAADVVCPQMNMSDFANLCLKLLYERRIRAGQILLEKNKNFWLHIANDPALFLTEAQMKQRLYFSRYGIAWNFNNGKAGYWHELRYGAYFDKF